MMIKVFFFKMVRNYIRIFFLFSFAGKYSTLSRVQWSVVFFFFQYNQKERKETIKYDDENCINK